MGILSGIGGAISDFGSAAGRTLFGDNRARNAAMAESNTRLEGGDMLRGYAQQQMMGAQGRPTPQAQAQ
ncbi:MAG: hypothetical protein VW547_11850, partial [Alphaproteobacteria bacterium]